MEESKRLLGSTTTTVSSNSARPPNPNASEEERRRAFANSYYRPPSNHHRPAFLHTHTPPPKPEPTEGGTEGLTIMVGQSLMLVAALVMVCITFSSLDTSHSMMGNGTRLVVRTYVLAPFDAGCLAWMGGECVQTNPPRWNTLEGILPVSEHRALGLFSEMNPVVIAFCAQAILTALHMGALPLFFARDPVQKRLELQTQWFFRKTGLAILVVSAVLLLFMQSKWVIPQNNLMWLEGLLAIAFVLLGHSSSESFFCATPALRDDQMRGTLLASTLAMPMLCVSALSTAGETDTVALLLAYFGLCCVPLLPLVGFAAPAAIEMETHDEEGRRHWPTRVSLWLCAMPFIVYASLRFYAANHNSDTPLLAPSSWTIVCLAFALAWVLLTVILLNMLIISIASHADGAPEEEETTAAAARILTGKVIFIWFQQIAGATVLLTLLIGLFMHRNALASVY